MNKKEFSANTLFVVKPSVVLFDETKSSFRELMVKTELDWGSTNLNRTTSLGNMVKSVFKIQGIKYKTVKEMSRLKKATERNINELTHIVEFETRPEDTTIALEESFLLKSIETNKVINS